MLHCCQLPIAILYVVLSTLQINGNIIVTQRDFLVEVVPVIRNGTTGERECPPDVDRQLSLHLLRNATRDILRSSLNSQISRNCGPGLWRRVFYLNSSNSDQSCPGSWNIVTTPTRACRGASSSCRSAFSGNINAAYSKVCGRLIGEAINSPDAFRGRRPNRRSIENNYLDGVSITHGQPGLRSHIWSFGAGYVHRGLEPRCPCDNDNRNEAPFPPTEVGENYFCDRFDGLGHLWEGVNCMVDNPCCSFHNPPYFSIQLPMPTTDSIELRICNNQNLGDESVLVLFAEVYVQ